MQLVNITSDDSFTKVLLKAREILRETPPVQIDNKLQPLCSDDAIDLCATGNKLRKEQWCMNHLDDKRQPTDKTDAFMCFGTLDFGELFYLNKQEEGVEDFQKNDFKKMVRDQKVHFSLAKRTGSGYGTSYTAPQKADPPWFQGFLDEKNDEKKGKRYETVCMLHWVAKKKDIESKTTVQRG